VSRFQVGERVRIGRVYGPKAPFSFKRARVATVIGDSQYVLYAGGPFVYSEESLTHLGIDMYPHGKQPGYLKMITLKGEANVGTKDWVGRRERNANTANVIGTTDGGISVGEGIGVQEGQVKHGIEVLFGI
jgi:hypothetical protein